MTAVQQLVLAGISGSGKSTLGQLAARELGWNLVDTDAAVEQEYGTSVPEIFSRFGEAAFRETERMVLARALAGDPAVIATGGGAVVDAAAWTAEMLRRPGVLVVALDASPETSVQRLSAQRQQAGDAAGRPLLEGSDPLERIRAMKRQRQSAYDRADITLIVDNISPERLAEELVRLVRPHSNDEPDTVLRAKSGDSRIWVEPGHVRRLPQFLRQRWPKARRAWVVSDEHVAAAHGAAVRPILAAGGFDVRFDVVAPREQSKSIAGVSHLYDWLLGNGVERSDVIVALGGGMVGDLAGFAAATTLRGIGFAQVPTTLLAAVDSSVGGKTGINHPAGKNLIGAFYQPPVVVVDSNLLLTMPERDFRSGWAEIIKHAFIQRSTPGGERGDLPRFLERNVVNLRRRSEPALSYLIRRNIELKSAVVTEDEREGSIRAYLNLGHTLGHAIEAADYSLLHGEAIALGLRGALAIGEEMGTCGADEVKTLDQLLSAFDLPLVHHIDPDRVLGLMVSDKKRVAGQQRWVLPLAGGGVAIRSDVPEQAIGNALSRVDGAGGELAWPNQ